MAQFFATKHIVLLALAAAVTAGSDPRVNGQEETGNSAAAGPARTYLKPGTPEVGGVRHLMLIYADLQQAVPWDSERLLPYVTYVDRRGKPQDWFFDSFLWLGYITNDGTNLSRPVAGGRAIRMADWQWLLESLFNREHGVGQLEPCVRQAAESLPDKDHQVNLIITMPTPMPTMKDFGPLEPGGPLLDFSRDGDRLTAMKWYIRAALERWKKIDAPHVRLVGCYWLAETIPPADRAIVRQTADFLHSQGMKLYWIPFFGAKGIDGWQKLGIDAAMLQPNYSTFADAPPGRLAEAARIAQRVGMGVELELPYTALREPERRARYLAYLDAGAKYGFMRHSILGYFQSVGLLGDFAASPDPATRAIYDQTYRFVKGTYRPKALKATGGEGKHMPATREQ
jgi:hypothetical protein